MTTAVSTAVSGDTVNIDAAHRPCTVAYSAKIAVAASKAITIDGGGNTTLSLWGFQLNSPPSSSAIQRMTGFIVTNCNPAGTANQYPVTGDGSPGQGYIRIDHNTFTTTTSNNTCVTVSGNGPVEIDHNTFNTTQANGPNELIHVTGYGTNNTTGWTTNLVTDGSQNDTTVVEDNTFSLDLSGQPFFFGASALQSYNGARTIFRHNLLINMQIDQHGTPGLANVGARFFDINNNEFRQVASSGGPTPQQCCYIEIRAGSGFIHDNTHSGTNATSNVGIDMFEEDTGTWPRAYQAGSGWNGQTDGHSTCASGTRNTAPIYIWNNDAAIAIKGDGGENPGVDINRDYFVSGSQPSSMFGVWTSTDTCSSTHTYTAMVYPNPVQTGGGPITPIISSINPVLGPVGTSVTITGSNFGASQAAGSSTITVNGTNVTSIASWSDTSITFTVPVGATTGNVVITVSSLVSLGTNFTVTTNGIPSTRQIDWTHVGIPGGIPSAAWPICATLSPIGGGADDSTAIQTAINNCAAGSVVKLNAGTFTIHRTGGTPTVCPGKSDDFGGGVYEAGLCLTDKSVVLRGAGANQTTINYGDGANIISMGTTYLNGTNAVYINVTAGASQGSTSITLASVAGLAIGNYLGITETNPIDSDGNPLVQTQGNSSNCTFCGHNQPTKVMIQVDRITNIAGSVVTLERPLYIDYTNAPQVYKIPMIENVGLENLKLASTVSSGTGIVFKNINLEACAHCWVHNVESDLAVDRANIYMSDVYGSEISNNYLFDGYSHLSGETYAIYGEFRLSENLVVNNIIRKARHSTILIGGSGNVFAYNYMFDSYQQLTQNSLPEKNTHGAHPYMNLWEGNYTPNINFDFVAGSASHNTVFRNYVPLLSTNPSTGTPMTGGLYALTLAYYNNYFNVYGNVFGPNTGTCTATNYERNADQADSATIYKLGYFDDGGTASPNLTLSAKVGATILRGGNWDCNSASVIWNNNVPSGSIVTTYAPSQTLPNSLYLTTTPNFFTVTGVPFPPIAPNAGTRVNALPAQICYASGPGSGGAYDPATCYGEQAPGVPIAQLTANVLTFGPQRTQTTSVSQPITLTNTGSFVLSISSIVLGGTNPSDFFQSNTCPIAGNLGISSSCVITVTFTPTAIGSRTATITLTDSASDSPQTITLNGTGISPNFSSQINAAAKPKGAYVIK